jgi:hypothetical protein
MLVAHMLQLYVGSFPTLFHIIIIIIIIIVGVEWPRHVAGKGEMRVTYELLRYHVKI